MAEGGSFQIASGFVRVTAQPDADGAENAMQAMGGRMAAVAGGLGLGALVTKGLVDNLNAGAATAKLQAQMGLTKGVAADMGKASGEIYRDGFGGSISEVNDSIKAVGTNIGDLSSMSKTEIKSMSSAALGLSEVFGVDVNDSTKAAGQMMKNGLAKDGKEAMDIITKGMQMGLDSSGDFLDTMTEYSPQFTKLGIDGPQALGLLSQGLKAGAKDTDVIADAFKEFSLRAIDGSKQTSDAYKGIGLDADKTSAAIAKGGPSAQKATAQVIEGLKKVKDPQEQNRIGVALFGTQWEDTLRTIIPKMDMSAAATTKVKDSTKTMNDTMAATPQAKIEGVKRAMEGWLMSATQLPGPLGTIGAGMIAMGPGAITAAAGISVIAANMGLTVASIGTAIKAAAAWALQTVKSAATATASVVATVARQVAAWVVLGVQSMLAAARVAAAWLISLGPIAIVIAAVVGLVALIIANWDTIKSAIGKAWDWIKEKTVAIWNGLKEFMKKAFEFLKNIFLNFTGPGLIIKHWETIKKATGAAWKWVKDSVSSAFNFLKDIFFKFTGPGIVIKHWAQIKNFITNSINSAKKAVTDAVGKIVSSVTGIKDRVMSALSGAGKWLVESGKKIIQGLIDGIKNMAGNVKDAIGGVLSDARDLLPFSPAKEGPFSGKGWTTYSGASIVDGMIEGVDSRIPSLAAKMGSMVKTASVPVHTINSPTVPVRGNLAVPSMAGTQQRVQKIQNLNVHIKGILDPKNPQATRELIAELHERLDDYAKEYAR